MKSKLPPFGLYATLIGATATVVIPTLYIYGGSNGDAPDMARLSLTQSSTASGLTLNLPLAAASSFEPDHYQGEAPVNPNASNLFKI